jgi:cytosine/adenosine deaminase-related metal-dependent hydrolase
VNKTMRAVHADVVITGDAEPIRDGAIVVDSGGTVVDVGPATDVLVRHVGAGVERVHGVLLPGLVNAHTHLELSALRGQIRGGAGFVPWVEEMLGIRAEGRPEEDDLAIDRAIDELVAFGTSAVGEVTNSLVAVRGLARRNIAGSIFHEVFGIEREPLERRVADLPKMVEESVGTWPTTDLAYAPSPHTLYTTHADVVRRLVRDAKERGLRASLHLAEHAAERRFLEHGDGPVAVWYEARLKLRRELIEWPGKASIALADDLGALGPHMLCVHLTDARPDELDLVVRREASVVLCPRSNLHIETRLPPLLAALTAGLFPALGTDSLASNSSLDVLAEARALADRFPTVSPRDLLRMATWEGARALGRSDLGRIVRGAKPGLFAIDGDPRGDGCAFVLAHTRAPRRWVVRRGDTEKS